MLKPIVESYLSQRRPGRSGREQVMLIARCPRIGGILRRLAVPASFGPTDVAELALAFAREVAAWYDPWRNVCLVSRCEEVLL